MSKEADAKAGLLGKVAKFIRHPTVDWADIDRSEPPSSQLSFDTSQSRLALKEMIKRKRRNDLVRKREFDMLRKIRRKGKGAQIDGPNTMALTSLYSSSQLAQDAEKWDDEQKREWTLRQIDEIEAQLSHTWFHKPGDAPTMPMKLRAAQRQSRTAAPALAKGTSGIPASDFTPATLPTGSGILGQPRPPDPLPGASAPIPSSLPAMEFEPVSMPDQPDLPVLTHTYQPQAARGVADTPAQREPEAPKPPPEWKNSVLDGLTVQTGPGKPDLREPSAVAAQPASPLLAAPTPEPRRRASFHENALDDHIEVIALRQDPEIEEAAVSFANGDEVVAELTLLKLVSSGGSRRKDVEAWLTLFDLYRVTGKSEAFEGLVPEFTMLFGRSAPQWERERESAPDKAAPGRKNAAPQVVTRAGAFAWGSPAQLSVRALTVLTGALERAAPPWRIDWRAVSTVEPDALPRLKELFTQWADMPTQLQVLGGEQLLAVLAQQSPAQDKSVNPAWWRVRLALLRLMGAPDLFDQAALDYCITYEISPPAWTPPKGSYTPLSADGQPELSSADEPTLAASVSAAIAGDLPSASTDVFEATLEGEILGSAQQALAALPPDLASIHSLELDCRALRRVDFGAAGELLNWSIGQQSQGRLVTFRGVHRLLAAFFSVIGINTAAQVVLRKD